MINSISELSGNTNAIFCFGYTEHKHLLYASESSTIISWKNKIFLSEEVYKILTVEFPVNTVFTSKQLNNFIILKRFSKLHKIKYKIV